MRGVSNEMYSASSASRHANLEQGIKESNFDHMQCIDRYGASLSTHSMYWNSVCPHSHVLHASNTPVTHKYSRLVSLPRAAIDPFNWLLLS